MMPVYVIAHDSVLSNGGNIADIYVKWYRWQLLIETIQIKTIADESTI